MSEVQDIVVSDSLRDEVFDLSERGAISPSDVQCDKELQRAFRTLAKENLYFFCKAVLGYKDISIGTHLEFCLFIQDLLRRFAVTLFPRGCFKTSIGTKGFGPWYLINNPEHSILIANQVARNAELMLLEIEQQFEGTNPLINWLFPEMVKPGDKHKPWNAEMMLLPNAVNRRGTPSIMTIGVGGRAESLHFHLIINDDLIGEKAMESATEMTDVVAWHDYSTSLFVSPATGIERVYGTRWDLTDLYSILIEDPKYDVMIRKAVNDDGTPFFPEFLPLETLREIRERNYVYYMSQYMNDPANPELLDFKPGWLRKYQLIKTEKGPACEVDGSRFFVSDMNLVLTVDPAGSGDVERRLADDLKRGRARKSNNAVEAWGLHGSGRYFLLDLWAGRGHGENPELEVAEQMLSMVKRWGGYLHRGYVESYGAQRGLITIFNMLAREEGLFFTLEEIPRGMQQAKKVRIRTYLGPSAQNGMVHVRPSHDQFIMEWGHYPQSDMFDTLDAAAWAFFKLTKPASIVEETMTKARNEKKKAARLLVVGRAGY